MHSGPPTDSPRPRGGGLRGCAAAALRRWVAGADDARLERTFGSRAGAHVLFRTLAAAFPAERAGLTTEVCIEVRRTDGVGRRWTLLLTPEAARARPGGTGAAPVSLAIGLADLLRIAAGELDAGEALLTSRMDVAGDLALAMQLAAVLERR